MDADRETFIRDNAVALVEERDAKIRRQALALSKANYSIACLRRERKKLQDIVDSLSERVARQSELLARRAVEPGS